MCVEVAEEIHGDGVRAAGNLARAAQPSNGCEFKHLAFFQGLSTDQPAAPRSSVAAA
ncbi:hypothetical protein CFP65_4014 [Kitasatospora sp. MMS16-BH015]|uniref:hypothetical protein n=1 Tax=Kitasatospora sp. MMS16-BH015 TaxID=2018025 RepID=UPI000CA18424|nr:hypothetical protein [Kitasatospora sp. MMS16-BH015]AUG78781.1 hypothetical protein CFP65_4014 [Kitasatospora sp. MMS16-BH015]